MDISQMIIQDNDSILYDEFVDCMLDPNRSMSDSGIKLIFLDVDGTLVNGKEGVSELTKHTLKEAIGLGVKIAIASGRSDEGVRRVIDDIGLSQEDVRYHVCFNGAQTIDSQTGQVVTLNALGIGEYKQVKNFVDKLGLNTYGVQNDIIFSDKINEFAQVEVDRNGARTIETDKGETLPSGDVCKIVISRTKEELDSVEKQVNEAFGEKYTVLRGADNSLEVLKKGTDKGYALTALAKVLDVPIRDTMAMGDGGNDIGMLKSAGHGIAMGNAEERVLDAAKENGYTVEQNGVAIAIENAVLQPIREQDIKEDAQEDIDPELG